MPGPDFDLSLWTITHWLTWLGQPPTNSPDEVRPKASNC